MIRFILDLLLKQPPILNKKLRIIRLDGCMGEIRTEIDHGLIQHIYDKPKNPLTKFYLVKRGDGTTFDSVKDRCVYCKITDTYNEFV